MSANKKDFYEVLGTSKGASPEELKKAYRKMALEWHPDRHQGADKEEAEKRFKEINEAYQVLSDPQKKAAYDQHGHAAFTPGGGAGGNPFAGGPFSYSYTSTGGQNPFGDFGDPMDIFEQFFGGAFRSAPRKPRYAINIDFMEAVKGIEKEVEIEGKRRKIKIPAGVENGMRIDFNDFTLTIGVRASKEFERDGSDVYGRVTIPFSMAVMGGNVEVPTVDGAVKIKVRAGTKPHTMMRLRGKGHGDHYVQIEVGVPEKLTREQRTLVNEMKKAGL